MTDFDHLPVHPGSVPDGSRTSILKSNLRIAKEAQGFVERHKALAESHAELLKQMKTVQRYFGCGTWEWDDGEIFDTAAIAKAITRAERVGGE